MLYKLLLLLFALLHDATSVAIDLNPTITPTASNRITPHCFTPDTIPNVRETNLKDCRDALLVLARTPDFTTQFSFSKNPQKGIKLPLGWRSGECMIVLSCENDEDALTLRYADALRVGRTVVENCVGTTETAKWGLLRWGGLDRVGNSETFYVTVGRPIYRPPVGNDIPLELVNGTLLNPAIRIS